MSTGLVGVAFSHDIVCWICFLNRGLKAAPTINIVMVINGDVYFFKKGRIP
jgi:hypothetical protein